MYKVKGLVIILGRKIIKRVYVLSGGGGFIFSTTLHVAGSLDNLRVKKGLKFSSIFCV